MSSNTNAKILETQLSSNQANKEDGAVTKLEANLSSASLNSAGRTSSTAHSPSLRTVLNNYSSEKTPQDSMSSMMTSSAQAAIATISELSDPALSTTNQSNMLSVTFSAGKNQRRSELLNEQTYKSRERKSSIFDRSIKRRQSHKDPNQSSLNSSLNSSAAAKQLLQMTDPKQQLSQQKTIDSVFEIRSQDCTNLFFENQTFTFSISTADLSIPFFVNF